MIDMPPKRALPGQVRDQMLMTLRAGLDEPRRRSRAPLAVAAGVAALVASGVVVATTLHGDSGDQAASAIPGAKGVEVAAQRCRAAAAKIGGYPDGAQWRVVTHTALAGFTDLAIKVADKPVFCETTATSVTISKFGATPAYVPGSRTGTVFRGGSYLLGMVVDPSWDGIDAYENGIIDSAPAPQPVSGWRYAEGMVLWQSEYRVPLTVARHGAKPAKPVPEPVDRAVTVVDRPYDGPAPDRTSEGGKLLAACIERSASTNPLADADTWLPGALLRGDTDVLLVIRGIDRVTTCFGRPADTRPGGMGVSWWGGELREVRLPAGEKPVLAPSTDNLSKHAGSSDLIVYGAVGMDAAKMTLTTKEHKTVTAVVRNGTFAADMRPYTPFADEGVEITSVTVWGTDGKVLYQGAPAK
jgi:hypothetical protein